MDHFVLSLEETMAGKGQDHEFQFGDIFGAFSKNLRFQPAEPMTGRFVEHRDLLDDEVALARSLYLKFNPTAMIQRVWRGNRVRVHLFETRAVRQMQGITRGFLVRRRKALGLDPIKSRSMRMPAGFLQNVEWRVYFSHERADLMRDLVLRVIRKAAGGVEDATTAGLVQFTWSEYHVIRSLEQGMEWSHVDDVTGVETSTKWVTGGVARRTRSRASDLCSPNNLWLRLPWQLGQQPHNSAILQRRPLNLMLQLDAKKMIEHFEAGVLQGLHGFQAEQDSLDSSSPQGIRLLCWTAPNAKALMTLLDMVDLVNAGKHGGFWPKIEGLTPETRLRVVSDYTIRRLAGVTSIQAAWRAHRCRVELQLPLQRRLRQLRGRVIIQRWWRWRLLRRRIVFLQEMHDVVSNINSCEVYLPEKYFDRIDDITLFKQPTLFLEQKTDAVLLRADRIALLSQPAAIRQGFPAWTLGGQVPVVDERPDGPMAQKLGDPTNSMILNFSADMDPVCPAVRSMVFLAHHNFVRLRFQTVAEARARAAVLMARTWKGVHRGSFALRLMSLPALQSHGAAQCIQSAIRGRRIRTAYVHYLRASSRLSQAIEDGSGDRVDGSRGAEQAAWTPRPPLHQQLRQGTGRSPDGDLVISGEFPVALSIYQFPGREALTLGTKSDLAKTMRENAQDAMRGENEKQLAELAQLQLKARQQKHSEKSRTVREPKHVDPEVKVQLKETVKEMREGDIALNKHSAERIKMDRAAAREQLRREKMAADRDRYDRVDAENAQLRKIRELNALHAKRELAATSQRIQRYHDVARGVGDEKAFASNFARQNNAISKQIATSDVRRLRDGKRNNTIAEVRSRKHHADVRHRQNVELLALRMEAQQRKVADDTIRGQNQLAAGRATELQIEGDRRASIRAQRARAASIDTDAILASQRQPLEVPRVIAKFVEELPTLPPLGAR